jgi:hypothetical protein
MKNNTKQQEWAKIEKYEKGHELVAKSLRHIFDENFGKLGIVDGLPPFVIKEIDNKKVKVMAGGYQNISAFHIKMSKKPKEYDGDEYKHGSDSN